MAHVETPAPKGVEREKEPVQVSDAQKFFGILLIAGLVILVIFGVQRCSSEKSPSAPKAPAEDSGQTTDSSTHAAERSKVASPGVPAARESSSGSSFPDVPRAMSNALSAPVRWLDKVLPTDRDFFVKKEAQKSLPRPPANEWVIEVRCRPGVVVWPLPSSPQQGMAPGDVTPWFEMIGDLDLSLKSGGLGRQVSEFYPKNRHIVRFIEVSQEGAPVVRVSGEKLR